jgi:hypothetical protein
VRREIRGALILEYRIKTIWFGVVRDQEIS